MFLHRLELAAFSVDLRHACSAALADVSQELRMKNREGDFGLLRGENKASADLVSSCGAK